MASKARKTLDEHLAQHGKIAAEGASFKLDALGRLRLVPGKDHFETFAPFFSLRKGDDGLSLAATCVVGCVVAWRKGGFVRGRGRGRNTWEGGILQTRPAHVALG